MEKKFSFWNPLFPWRAGEVSRFDGLSVPPLIWIGHLRKWRVGCLTHHKCPWPISDFQISQKAAHRKEGNIRSPLAWWRSQRMPSLWLVCAPSPTSLPVCPSGICLAFSPSAGGGKAWLNSERFGARKWRFTKKASFENVSFQSNLHYRHDYQPP